MSHLLKSRKKVLVIAYIFPPLARAGVHRTVRFVRYLPDLDWDVTVLTADPKYYPPRSPIDEGLLHKIPASVNIEATKIFNGTTKFFELKSALRSLMAPSANILIRQAENAVNSSKAIAAKHKFAQSVNNPKGIKQKAKDFIYDLFTFPDKDVNWLPYAVARGIKLHQREKFDLIYSTAPPFTGHLVARLLKGVTGLPWVADFRDPWARAPWKASLLNGTFRGKAADKLEKVFVEGADRIILNTDWNLREFTEHYGARLARKFSVITNGFDPQDFDEQPQVCQQQNKLIITHTGALYRKRNPKHFLEACSNLIAENKISPDELEIRFIGGIAAELSGIFDGDEQVRQIIKVLPPVSHQEALRYQIESDILLILQPGTSVSVPGKIFEYIGMRKNVLALTCPGATADVVTENNLGSVVDPENIPAIENALMTLVEQYRQGQLAPPAVDGAFKRYNGIELTKTLHNELLSCLENAKNH